MAEIVDFKFRVNFKIPLKLTLFCFNMSAFRATWANGFQRLLDLYELISTPNIQQSISNRRRTGSNPETRL